MSNRDVQTKFEAYLLTEKYVAHNTFCAYKRDIEQLMKYLEEQSLPVEQCTVKNIKEFIHYLYAQQISTATIARKIASLKKFFSYMAEHHGMSSIMKSIKIPKQEKKLPVYLAKHEIQKILTFLEEDTSALALRNKLLMYFLYMTGLRVSELVALRYKHIICDTKSIIVSGKGGKERIVPLPDILRELYLKYMHENNAQPDHCLFFRSPAHPYTPLSRQACWLIVKNMCQLAGIEKAVSPHQLRHSLATHMLDAGIDLRSLQLLLGHEHIKTVQIYTHVETTHLRTVYNKKHPRS
ncbi:MAG TPA: tyrosine-type recombinase/integrase [Candidatus Bathyarchaeia archaeon]|nr:tyrosine-type recombinase/integrase [Candidatus Bathyarchaeia archaeon]